MGSTKHVLHRMLIGAGDSGHAMGPSAYMTHPITLPGPHPMHAGRALGPAGPERAEQRHVQTGHRRGISALPVQPDRQQRGDGPGGRGSVPNAHLTQREGRGDDRAEEH